MLPPGMHRCAPVPFQASPAAGFGGLCPPLQMWPLWASRSRFCSCMHTWSYGRLCRRLVARVAWWVPGRSWWERRVRSLGYARRRDAAVDLEMGRDFMERRL